MKKLALYSALLAFVSIPSLANAQDMGDAVPSDAAYLSLGLGEFDIFDGDDTATDFRIEYRDNDAFFWKLKPWVGGEATTDGTIWAGGGVLADFNLAPNIYMIPSFGAGLYTDGGSNKDLGYGIEFRTQLEGGYEFTNGHRVGVALSHISNANLDDTNPGAEVLNVYYHIPVNSMF